MSGVTFPGPQRVQEKHEIFIPRGGLLNIETPGHNRIAQFVQLRLQAQLHPYFQGRWIFQCGNPVISGIAPQPFEIGENRVVKASKIPVPKACLERDKADLEATLKDVEADIKMVDAFLKNPSHKEPRKIIDHLLNLECNLSEKADAIPRLEGERKTEMERKVDFEASLKLPLSPAGKAALEKALKSSLERIDKLTNQINDLRVGMRELEVFREKGGQLPKCAEQELTRILQRLQKQKSSLIERIEAYVKIDDNVSVKDWLTRLKFFERLNISEPPDLDHIPAWQVTSFSEADEKAGTAAFCPAVGMDDEVFSGSIFSLVFSDDGSQVGARAFGRSETLRSGGLINHCILYPECLRTAPSRADINEYEPWKDLEVSIRPPTAKDDMISRVANQSFHVFLFKFSQCPDMEPLGDSWEHCARAGITSNLILDSSEDKLKRLGKERHRRYKEHSIVYLRVSAYRHPEYAPNVLEIVNAVTHIGTRKLESYQ